LRQYHIDDKGLQIGEMLTDQEGLLGGRPTSQPTETIHAGDNNV